MRDREVDEDTKEKQAHSLAELHTISSHKMHLIRGFRPLFPQVDPQNFGFMLKVELPSSVFTIQFNDEALLIGKIKEIEARR